MRTLRERFEAKIKLQPTGCIEWQAGLDSRGYGQIRTGNKTALAHRVSYKINKGPIPDGLCVCHACDNPLCVNPDHLFLGTHRDNSIDCVKKGRAIRSRADDHYCAKLNSVSVGLIREALSFGFQSKQLAGYFKVSTATIYKIKHSISWKDPITKSPSLASAQLE